MGTPYYLDLCSFPYVAADPDDLPNASFASTECVLEYPNSALAPGCGASSIRV